MDPLDSMLYALQESDRRQKSMHWISENTFSVEMTWPIRVALNVSESGLGGWGESHRSREFEVGGDGVKPVGI